MHCALQTQHWLPMLLDHAGTQASVTSITSCLVILAALSHAAFKANRSLPGPLLQHFAQWAASEQMRACSHSAAQRQLVMVVANMVDLSHECVHDVAEPLFHILLHLQGNAQLDEYTQQQIQKV